MCLNRFVPSFAKDKGQMCAALTFPYEKVLCVLDRVSQICQFLMFTHASSYHLLFARHSAHRISCVPYPVLSSWGLSGTILGAVSLSVSVSLSATSLSSSTHSYKLSGQENIFFSWWAFPLYKPHVTKSHTPTPQISYSLIMPQSSI